MENEFLYPLFKDFEDREERIQDFYSLIASFEGEELLLEQRLFSSRKPSKEELDSVSFVGYVFPSQGKPKKTTRVFVEKEDNTYFSYEILVENDDDREIWTPPLAKVERMDKMAPCLGVQGSAFFEEDNLVARYDDFIELYKSLDGSLLWGTRCENTPSAYITDFLLLAPSRSIKQGVTERSKRILAGKK